MRAECLFNKRRWMSKRKHDSIKRDVARAANRRTPTDEARKVLRSKRAYGESRHEDKIQGRDTFGKIYSFDSFKTYVKQSSYFTRWCEEAYGCKNLEECEPHIEEYLAKIEADGLSAHTIKTRAAAIGKVYGRSVLADVKTPTRNRADIQRSRGEAERDGGFSEERNKAIVRFAKGTGLREHELKGVRGTQLTVDQDGNTWISGVRGKGGKVRDVLVRPEYAETVKQCCLAAGDDRVFKVVPSHMDTHGYRREYANAWYSELARDVLELPRAEVYHCQRDKAGTWYDKAAMREVTQWLGHNRISVMASNYLD